MNEPTACFFRQFDTQANQDCAHADESTPHYAEITIFIPVGVVMTM